MRNFGSASRALRVRSRESVVGSRDSTEPGALPRAARLSGVAVQTPARPRVLPASPAPLPTPVARHAHAPLRSGSPPLPTADARYPSPTVDDQAATLRRLFPQPVLRVLPVLLPETYCATRASWVAKLAQAFAQQGERTLLVDAARAQVAAALGLRARYDLAQAINGDCLPEAVLLDAGPNLGIVPAGRALSADSGRAPQALLTALQPALSARGGCDLVLLLVTAAAEAALARLPAGDVLVPLPPQAAPIAQALRDIERVHARRGGAAQGASADLSRDEPADNASTSFRLLFLGMALTPATTLVEGLMQSQAVARSAAGMPPALALAGAVRVARDLAGVVRASAGWPLAATPWTQ